MDTLNIAAIILAAGHSHRFGPANKLLVDYQGAPLIDHCLNLVCAHPFNDRILVSGFESKKIDAHITGLPVRTIFNSKYEEGMGASLATGVRALKSECEAFMVFLADMPDIQVSTITDLITAYSNNETKSIVRPVYQGKPGHPVLFAAHHTEELRTLTGDNGANSIVRKHKTSTLNVDVNSPALIRDIDQMQDLK